MAQKWVSFEEVKSRVSMTDVLTHYGLMQGTLEKPSKHGTELRLHCPFHEDATPSLSINAETGKFHCFGCHAKGGDIFDFVVAKEGISAGDRTKSRRKAALLIQNWNDGAPAVTSAPEKSAAAASSAPGSDDVTEFVTKITQSTRFDRSAVARWRAPLCFSVEGLPQNEDLFVVQRLTQIARDAGAMTVMFDGGIRRGTHVLKALALGAKFVFIGRPFNYAAAVGGEAGVAHALRLLGVEIDRDLALLGVNSIAEIGPDRLVRL